MDDALRHAWTKLISAADLDDHMHQVGQAAANAALLQSMLATNGREEQTSLLIVGGGTAQFLDYISPTIFAQYDVTCSDINPTFLDRARERFAQASLQKVWYVIDDIEVTQLKNRFDVVVVVLVLEHIDWQRGLQNIHKLAPTLLHIVIQQNPVGMVDAIAPRRALNKSMQALAETARPVLVASDRLIDFLKQLGYRLQARDERPVPDSKTMVGLSFNRE